MTRSLLLLAAVACFATAPVIAQQPAADAAAKPAARAVQPVAAGGPRLQQDFHSYQPALAHETATSSNAAAAADNVVITISTIGLVLLGVLLILLLT